MRTSAQQQRIQNIYIAQNVYIFHCYPFYMFCATDIISFLYYTIIFLVSPLLLILTITSQTDLQLNWNEFILISSLCKLKAGSNSLGCRSCIKRKKVVNELNKRKEKDKNFTETSNHPKQWTIHLTKQQPLIKNKNFSKKGNIHFRFEEVNDDDDKKSWIRSLFKLSFGNDCICVVSVTRITREVPYKFLSE